MSKVGLTIDEQINHLKTHKNIHFDDETTAKKYLLKHSYADVITPLKTLFSSGYCSKNQHHLYENKTNWSDIKRIHQDLQKLEATLLQATLSLELELKSVFCVWLSEYLQISNISFVDFMHTLPNIKVTSDGIEKTVTFFNANDEHYQKEYEKIYKDYGHSYNDRWWLLIMALSFNNFRHILSRKINTVKIYDSLKNECNLPKNINLFVIGILRNSLAHNTNLLIFLDKPFRIEDKYSNYKQRSLVIRSLLSYSINNPLEPNSVINRYNLLRNNSADNFSSLKI